MRLLPAADDVRIALLPRTLFSAVHGIISLGLRGAHGGGAARRCCASRSSSSWMRIFAGLDRAGRRAVVLRTKRATTRYRRPARCRNKCAARRELRRRTSPTGQRRSKTSARHRQMASAVSFAGVAPLTMKLAPGSAWNAATSVGSLTQSWAQAARPRNVRTEFGVTSGARSKRRRAAPCVGGRAPLDRSGQPPPARSASV